MMGRAKIGLLVGLFVWPNLAAGHVPQTFGVGSRAAAMGGAFTGQADDFSASFYNPAGLATLPGAEVALAPLWIGSNRFLRDPGDRERAIGEDVTGYAVGFAGPVGALWDMPELAMGITLYLPWGEILDLTIPVEPDARFSPVFDGRLHRLSINPAIAYGFGQSLSVGLGLDLFLDLDVPTSARYRQEAARPELPRLEIDLTRRLYINPALYAGVLYRPMDALSIGFTYRQRQQALTEGQSAFYFDAGETPTLDFLVRYVAFFTPAESVLGVSTRPAPWLRGNLDLVWAQWSEYRGPHGEVPDPLFDDVLQIRAGASAQVHHRLALQAGYLWAPSPVPPQSGVTNFLGADRHVVTAGCEVHLQDLIGLSVAVHGQAHLLDDRHTTKDLARVPDAKPSSPGIQTRQLGLAGYDSGGYLLNVGVTLSWRPGS